MMNYLKILEVVFRDISIVTIENNLRGQTCGVRFVEMSAMLFTSLASDILNSLKSYLSVHLSLDNPRLKPAIVS